MNCSITYHLKLINQILIILFTLSIRSSFALEENINFKLVKSTVVETNFTYLDVKYFKSNLSNSLLIDQSLNEKVFFTEKNKDRFYELLLANNKINILNNFILIPTDYGSKKITKNKIVNIKFSQFDPNILYLSVVTTFESSNPCEVLLLYKYDISNKKFTHLFESKPCAVNAMEDIEAKISDSKNYIFLSSGNILLDNYHVKFAPQRLMSDSCVTIDDYDKCLESTNLYGKVIRINKNNYKSEIISTGNRRPQGIIWDYEEQRLFLTDHGPRGGDEINLIKKNKNYGWPYSSIGIPYTKEQKKINLENFNGSYNALNYPSSIKFEDPIYSFVPSIGISDIGKNFINGDFDIWGNNFLIGSLKDRSVYSVNISSSSQVKYAEKIYIGERIRNISTSKKNILLSTDNGSIIVLKRNFEKELNGAFPSYSP